MARDFDLSRNEEELDPRKKPGARILQNLTPEKSKEYENNVCSRVMQQFRNPWANARSHTVRKLLLNHAFYQGFHYVKHGRVGLTSTKRRYENQVRMTVNLFKPVMRSMLGQVTKNEPVLDLADVTADDYASEAETEMGRKLLRHLWGVNRMRALNLNLWYWMFLGGNAAKRVFFNEDAGPMKDYPKRDGEGNPLLYDREDQKERPYNEAKDIVVRELRQMEENQEDILEEAALDQITTALWQRFRPIYEKRRCGEVDVQILSPMEYMTDPSYLDLYEAPVAIIEQAQTLDSIEEIFGSDIRKKLNPDRNLQLLFDDTAGVTTVPGLNLPRITQQYTDGRSNYQDIAVVRELQVRGGAVNPITGKRTGERGAHFIWCQGHFLTSPDDPLPNAKDPELDLVDFQFLPSDSFWSSDFFSDLVPLVKANNRRVSQISETMNAFVHPKLMMQKGSKVRRGSPTDQAGEIIEWMGTPPSYLEPPGIRSYVFRMLDLYMEQFNDVSMRHEVTRQGRMPANVRTTSALELLQEQDVEALVPTMQLYDLSEGRVGEKMLDRVKEYYPKERKIEVVGKNNEVEALYFDKGKFFQRRWKVFVHQGSSLPEHRASKTQLAIDLLQYAPEMFVKQSTGTFNKRMLVQIMGRQDLEGVIQELDTTRQTAEEENLLLDDPQMDDPVVLPFEDHEAHVEIHVAFARSNEFKRRPREIQEAFFQHIQEHDQYLQEQRQRMAAMAQRIQQQAMVGAEMAKHNAAQGAASEAVEQVQKMTGQGGDEMAEAGRMEEIDQMIQGAAGGQDTAARDLFGGY